MLSPFNSHSPGATEQLPKGNPRLGPPPAHFIFGTLFPLPLSVSPSTASVLQLA